MALRDKLDETKLRSLTYGDNTPYVTVNIDNQKVTSNGKVLNVSNNGTMINSAIIDTSRITSVIGDKPWWAAQQIAIQAMNSRANFGFVEGRIKPTFTSDQQYTPLNTLAQVALNGIGGHIERKGLVPGDVINNLLGTGTYEAVKKREIDFADVTKNPLVTFYNNLLKPTELRSTVNRFSQSKIGKFVTNAVSLFTDPHEPIYKYLGGPNSVFGIGTTTIRRYYNSVDEINRSNLNNFEIKQLVPTNPTLDFRGGGTIITNYRNLIVEGLGPTAVANSENDISISDFSENIQTNITPLNSVIFEPTKNPLFNIYTSVSTATNIDASGSYVINNSSLVTTPSNNKITYNNGMTSLTFKSPGKGWYGISREVRVGSGIQDGINLTPLFTTAKNAKANDAVKIGGAKYNIRDLVKFRIEAVQTDTLRSTWMIFRAFITDYSDQVTAEWNGTKYIGRAEKFYTYGGFDRTVNISFKVAAISAAEMQPMYQKLNYLMSNMMGDYNKGIMRGPMSRMTVGNWLDRQPGVITSLTYKISNDSPWEIAMDETESGESAKKLILPHIVEVSLTFLPIGTQHKGKNLLPQRGADQSNIAQNENDTQFINDGKIPKSKGTEFDRFSLGNDVKNLQSFAEPDTAQNTDGDDEDSSDASTADPTSALSSGIVTTTTINPIPLANTTTTQINILGLTTR
jgi:hypothetical protein